MSIITTWIAMLTFMLFLPINAEIFKSKDVHIEKSKKDSNHIKYKKVPTKWVKITKKSN